MNKTWDENQNKRKTDRRSRLSRGLVIRYFLSLLLFAVVSAALLLMAWRVLSTFIIWQADNPIYQLLKYIEEYLPLFGGLYLMTGVVIITYYFMSKPLRYLDEIVEAAGKLVNSREAPLELPSELKQVEDELNLFREQGLRNEMLAREAEQRKNDLIVYLAHDLKTPLTSVIGYLNLLVDEPQISPELKARYTGIALDKAERLEDLINEFFEITRFNLTTLTLETETTNLTRMLEQVSSEFLPVLREKELTLRTDLQPDVSISCDRDKLERVFDNLLRNAVNYSYPASDITLLMKAGPGGVQITVSNHGKTIPPEKLGRIFEQFFRADSSRGTANGGAGLGLAIAKEIVQLHGGSISAESEHETITFHVWLPIEAEKKRMSEICKK